MKLYTEDIFKKAAELSARRIHFHKVKLTDKSGEVCKIEGSVTVRQRQVVNGSATYTDNVRKVRWDGTGHCFVAKGITRLRKYDLPVASI